MLITLLLVLGVDLIVIVALVAFVLGHKRWVLTRPGTFPGAIRVVSGEVEGLSGTWKRGSGRWVRDSLMWTSGPLLFRGALMPVDAVEQSSAGTDKLKRLGDHPSVIRLMVNASVLDLAAATDHRALLYGPFSASGTADAV